MSQSERQKYEKEVRDHQEGLVNAPDEFHFEVPGVEGEGESVGVHAVGDFVFVGTSTGKEVRFDRDSLVVLQQKLNACFQRVA